MKKIEKYTGNKTYMFPNGALATPEIVTAKYPAVLSFAHIVETDTASEVMFSLENLAAVRSMYNVDVSLAEDEAIAKIEEIRNTIPEYEPGSEERIAAALEFQNLLSL